MIHFTGGKDGQRGNQLRLGVAGKVKKSVLQIAHYDGPRYQRKIGFGHRYRRERKPRRAVEYIFAVPALRLAAAVKKGLRQTALVFAYTAVKKAVSRC